MAQRQFKSDDTDGWVDRWGNGSDGALSISSDTTDSTPNTTITGSSGGTSATAGSGTGFSSGNLVLIHQSQATGAGNWELNKISSVGSGTNWTMVYNLMNTYSTGAQVYLLRQYSSVSISSTKTLTGQAWDGSKGGILALLCNGSVTVDGIIDVIGKGFRGGAGSNGGTSTSGEGETGTGSANHLKNASGGAGGQDGAGSGEGGDLWLSDPDLSTKFGFGGAGGGCAGSGSTGDTGKNGSGIVLIIGKFVTVAGEIKANGLGGGTRGGGSGAGGSILIKSYTSSIGTNLVTAIGAAGPTWSANDDPGGAGGAVVAGAPGHESTGSSRGAIHFDYALSITGTSNPTLDSTQDSSLLDPDAIRTGYSFFM